ncbi:MAG: transglycosylase domain-containing protein [Oligoflexales bacterium]
MQYPTLALSRKKTLCIALGVLQVLLIALLCSYFFAYRAITNKLASANAMLQKKYGLTVSIESITPGLLAVHADGVKVGDLFFADRATITLDPWFILHKQPIAEISVRQLKTRLGQDGFEMLESLIKQKSSGSGARDHALLKYIPARVNIENFDVTGEYKSNAIKADGSLSLDIASHTLEFKIHSLDMGTTNILRSFSQKMQIVNSGKFVAIDGDSSKAQQLKIRLKKDLTFANIFFKSAGGESGLPIPQQYIDNAQDLNFAAALTLRREPTKPEVSFQFHAGSSNLSIAHPLLSKKPVRPIPFLARVNGTWNSKTRVTQIDSGKVALKRRGGKDVEVDFSLTASSGQTGDPSQQVLYVNMPSTPCQDVIDALPPAFSERLSSFRLEGNMSFEMKTDFSPAFWNQFSMEFLKPTINCKVKSSDFEFSRGRLLSNYPVTYNSDGTLSQDPLTVNVSTYTHLENVSRYVPIAFTAAEDGSFWSHNGIDFSAIEQALKRNLQESEVLIGGSTITMQTAKNLFLNHERNLARKVQEVFLAWHLEQVLPKSKIMELYLNIIEFGPGIIGIKQASNHFFGKEPSDLSLIESTYLASILPNPIGRYRNYCRKFVSANYRNLMLGIMDRALARNEITIEDYEIAKNTDLKFSNSGESDANCQNYLASYDLNERTTVKR